MNHNKTLLSIRYALRKVSQRFAPPQQGRMAFFPTELLITIFELATTNESRTSIAISHVNRRWRDIVLDLPQFWSTIELGDKEEKVSMFLERSKDAFIDVRYDVIIWNRLNPRSRDIARKYACQNLNLAAQHGGRWKSFYYADSEFSPWSSVLASLSKELITPNLASLRLPGPQYINDFRPLSALRSLEFDSKTTFFFHATYSIPKVFTQLNSIDFCVSNGGIVSYSAVGSY